MTRKKKTLGDQSTLNKIIHNEHNDKSNACTHMRQAINLAHLKKGSKDWSKIGNCQKCDKDTAKETSVYVCLQCGHQGCDRSSEHQHALKHFEACRSHSCAMNIHNFQIWCYKCDDFKTSDLKSVQECSDFIFKHFKEESDEATTSDVEVLKKEKSESPALSMSSVNLDKLSRVKGLCNLGNTCFFNSIMQCINQTCLFELRLKSKENSEIELNCHSKEDEVHQEENEALKKKSLCVKLGRSGGITKSLLSFYEDMKWENKKSAVVSPGTLFGSICNKAPQFRGFQQQDSHEVLRHLLDGIREEEIKKLQSGILNAYNVTKEDKNLLTEDKKKLIKDFGKSAKHTTADEVFGGCFLCTVTCEECLTPHQIYESFLDISLPILMDNSGKNDSFQENVKSYKTHEKFNKRNVPEEKSTSKHMSKKERKNAKKLIKHQNRKNKPQKLTLSQFNEMQEEVEQTTTESDVVGDHNEAGKEEDDAGLVDGTIAMNLIGGKSDGDEDQPVEDSSNHALSNGHIHLSDSDGDDDKEDEKAEDAIKRKDDHSLACSDLESIGFNEDASAHFVAAEEGHLLYEEFDYHSLSERKLSAMKMALNLLGDRKMHGECSVSSCLFQFTSPEFLLDNNKYLCDNCNKRSKGSKNLKYTVARRQVLIYAPPAILTLHLKRFQQTSTNFKKLNDHISFAEILDIAPYCSSLSQNISVGQTRVLYSLYGVVEHSGSMKGGHYTAYVKVREENKNSKRFLQTLSHENFSPELLMQLMLERQKQFWNCQSVSDSSITSPAGKWYHISDSHVSEVKDVSNVFRCQAYILFYERIL